MTEDAELVRGKNVVAVIDFRQTTIYPTDAPPGQPPGHLLAPDPRGRFHQVHHVDWRIDTRSKTVEMASTT
jgi:hypothetical protein